MTKRRERTMTEDGTTYKVPIGDSCIYGAALVSRLSMEGLVRDYGDKAFFRITRTGPVAIRWKSENRSVARLILKADSRFLVKHADGNKLNLTDENISLVRKKKSKREGEDVKTHNEISASKYYSGADTGLTLDPRYGSEVAMIGDLNFNGSRIEDALERKIRNQNKIKFFVSAMKAYCNATTVTFKQKKLDELNHLFEFQYKKRPGEHPEFFLKLAKSYYDERLTMEQLQRWGLLPAA